MIVTKASSAASIHPADATVEAPLWGDVPDNMSPLPERYEDLGLIASGATGQVRRVRDKSLNRVLAMKVLRVEHIKNERVRFRFFFEAEITAGLQHPGIVAVHDRGELRDGRLWFTMQEVRGKTFGRVIEEVHATPQVTNQEYTPVWTFRRAVDAFSRIVQAVGYAHTQGIVHRDLKPENLMVGEFGEVLVMDWGLARRIHSTPNPELPPPSDIERLPESADQSTRDGDILGTPAYMPPEQARGQLALHGPQSDVYSLGAILYHLLVGKYPYADAGPLLFSHVLSGPDLSVASAAPAGMGLPPELVSVCERAVRRDIHARYPDASEMANDLVAFLDGAARAEQALALVEKVRPLTVEIEMLRQKKAALLAAAFQLSEKIRPFDPPEIKAPVWELEDEAERVGRLMTLTETQWLEGLHGALSIEPNLASAHEALAEHCKERLLEAERAADEDASLRHEATLRAHDRGKYAALLRGEGVLSLQIYPSNANVTLHRYVEKRRRLTLEPGTILNAPVEKVPIQRGSYLCIIEAPGHIQVRYPVLIERGGHWDGSIILPAEGEILENEIFVPAGYAQLGGDPRAADGLPSQRIWVDSFVIDKYPVTVGQYLAFLNELVRDGNEETALACLPMEPGIDARSPMKSVFVRDDGGHFVLPDGWTGDLPMAQLSWFSANTFANYKAKKTGLPYRLPSELEREKAARGADGRAAPWGNHLDATFACVVESHRGPPGPVPVTAFPDDESPYGVRGLAGNVRDHCLEVWKREGPRVDSGRLVVEPAQVDSTAFRVIRGGTWGSSIINSRAASRFGGRPDSAWRAVGFRLARSY
ncbi:MAG: SUMF1/EgtB/PvdO family nonheme iron enzyme [Polyangiaceae bacterium]|nr:SUMF1/EgtB/PvdO family nonheme iron enzyme [Polyangiaceae bacterium]